MTIGGERMADSLGYKGGQAPPRVQVSWEGELSIFLRSRKIEGSVDHHGFPRRTHPHQRSRCGGLTDLLGVTIPLAVLATATLGYRLSRMTKSSTNLWSDISITVGYILALTCWALYIPQSFLSPGIKSPAALMEGSKGSFLSIPIWGMTMAFIKISIGLTLLRIQSTPNLFFKMFIWSNLFLAFAYGFGNMWFILFSCRPLSAAWGDFADPESAKCLPPESVRIASVSGAVVSVLTDVLLNLAPISLLWNLKRPLRERVVLGGLMALGLLAGVSSIINNLIIADFGKPGLDMWAMNDSISTWTSLEMLLGIIAACVPFCRPVIERCLSKVGIRVTSGATKGMTGQNGVYAGGGLGYQKADGRDTFGRGTVVGGGASSVATKELERSDSDEDLVVGGGVEMHGIRKHTNIQVHTQQRGGDEGEERDQMKYYAAV